MKRTLAQAGPSHGERPAKRSRIDPSNQPSGLAEDLANTVSFPLFNEPFKSKITKEIAKFVFENTIKDTNIEIEGKLGILRRIIREDQYDDDEDDDNVQQLPPLNLYLAESTVLNAGFKRQHRWKFDSGIEVNHFKHLNKILNAWCNVGHEEAQNNIETKYRKAPTIDYRRVLFIDKLYADKTRVSLNAETLEVAECLQKRGRDHLEVHTPDDGFDIRISASVENLAPAPPEHVPVKMIRAKDRLSYQWGIFSLDITSIHSYADPSDPETLIEEISETVQANQAIKREKRKVPPVPYPEGSIRSSEVELEIRRMDHLKFLKEKDARMDILMLVEKFVSHLESLSLVLKEMRTPYYPK